MLWAHTTDYLVSFQASPLTVQGAVSGDKVLIDGWRWVLGGIGWLRSRNLITAGPHSLQGGPAVAGSECCPRGPGAD